MLASCMHHYQDGEQIQTGRVDFGKVIIFVQYLKFVKLPYPLVWTLFSMHVQTAVIQNLITHKRYYYS